MTVLQPEEVKALLKVLPMGSPLYDLCKGYAMEEGFLKLCAHAKGEQYTPEPLIIKRQYS